ARRARRAGRRGPGIGRAGRRASAVRAARRRRPCRAPRRPSWRARRSTVPVVNGELRVVDHVPAAFARLVGDEQPRSIALSGGETARASYELLAVADIAWGDVDVYFGDERWVPVDDPDSNEGQARHAFLDEVMPRSVASLRRAGDTIE